LVYHELHVKVQIGYDQDTTQFATAEQVGIGFVTVIVEFNVVSATYSTFKAFEAFAFKPVKLYDQAFPAQVSAQLLTQFT
jgi:hypothetical protein